MSGSHDIGHAPRYAVQENDAIFELPRDIRLGRSTLRVVHEGFVQTVFEDGLVVNAVPQGTEQYRATARQLGYRDDVNAMNREHELLHTLVCLDKGEPWCLTLRGVAERSYFHGWQEEEADVMRFQRILNWLRRVG